MPSDIDIAQSVKPEHIATIAKGLGLQAEDYDLYGTTKAKVRLTTRQSECMVMLEAQAENTLRRMHAGEAEPARQAQGQAERHVR